MKNFNTPLIYIFSLIIFFFIILFLENVLGTQLSFPLSFPLSILIVICFIGFVIYFFMVAVSKLSNKNVTINEKNETRSPKKIITKVEQKSSNVIFKIPDGIYGIFFYAFIIALCILIFGDIGRECGVDYGPRFFGEC